MQYSSGNRACFRFPRIKNAKHAVFLEDSFAKKVIFRHRISSQNSGVRREKEVYGEYTIGGMGAAVKQAVFLEEYCLFHV